MGACGSTVDPAAIEHKGLGQSIEERLMQDMSKQTKVIKVLLLGAGECGKSTILKQMKILHNNGFSLQERKNYRSLIYKNTLESIQTLCLQCQNLDLPFDSTDNSDRAQATLALAVPQLLAMSDAELQRAAEQVTTLWKHDSGLYRALQKANEFNLLDSAPYFLNEISRLFRTDYIATPQDILRSRLPTTGIIQTEFKIDKFIYTMYDVGGQRGERRKWIHCFEKVTAIMFIASLSEYDQVLAEDRTRNRMDESLDLFEGIINLPWFRFAPIILFLNKNDLFLKKVMEVDIGIYFPAYKGGCNYEAGLQFIQDQYTTRNTQNPQKTIYVHVTDATHTENISFVWRSTKHFILEQNLTSSGLLMC